MSRYVITMKAQVEAPSAGAAQQQRQAMKNALGNPALKMMLESLGIKLVGYRVEDEVELSK